MKRKLFVSLAAVMSFGAFSTVNAENYVLNTAPPSFTTRGTSRVNMANAEHIDYTKDAVLANTTVLTLNGNNNVIDYHTNAATGSAKVFCYNRTIEYAPNSEYTLKGEINDPGIVYIISNAEAFYNNNYASGATPLTIGGRELETVANVKNLEQSWLTQIAIWKYQDSSFNSASINPEIYEKNISVAGSVEDYVYSNRAVPLWSGANQLVAMAKSYKESTDEPKITFEFDGKYELDKDNKVIKTGIIKTTGSVNTTIDLNKIPDGTKAYTKDGVEINAERDEAEGEFYLVIPVKNVENYSFSFDISAQGEKTGYYKGYEYVRSDGSERQPLVLVTAVTKPASGSIHLETSNIEDTSGIIATSVYFVGFMFLIAGLGVIYINVKPKKVQI